MSASVDFRAGSTASGGLGGAGGSGGRGGGRGGRGGGGGRGGRGGKGHYTPKGDFVTSTTLAIEAKKTNTADVQHVVAEHPHHSYGIAVEIQARGNHNATPCNSCARGAGPFDTGCVSFSSGYGLGTKGGRCTLRVGGARTRVRSGSLYRDKARTNTHLGSGFDLNTTDGVRDALAELRGMERALTACGRALEGGAMVEDVSSEDDEDDVESEGEGLTWEGFE
ncbi:hypothetical protein VE00_10301 [Pseudogymnoascus sp. WSF 3629]|nr:hypothetical protein VE00_10301 [Pseudogymnoascus sp. WSF 3629]